MMIFKAFLCLCLLALIAKPVFEFLETKLIYRDNGYGVARRKIVESEMALGASYLDAQDTLFMREMLGRVRREASDAVQSNPELWHMHIQTAKAAALGEIGATKPHLAQRFSDAVDGLTYGNVLYPAEAKMVDRLSVRGHYQPNPDQLAAVRIVGRR